MLLRKPVQPVDSDSAALKQEWGKQHCIDNCQLRIVPLPRSRDESQNFAVAEVERRRERKKDVGGRKKKDEETKAPTVHWFSGGVRFARCFQPSSNLK